MKVTPCLGRGFFGRSLDEFQRLSRIGIVPYQAVDGDSFLDGD